MCREQTSPRSLAKVSTRGVLIAKGLFTAAIIAWECTGLSTKCYAKQYKHSEPAGMMSMKMSSKSVWAREDFS